MTLKLGKLPHSEDRRDLKLANYLAPVLPKMPKNIGHEGRMPQPRLMLGNGPDESVAPGFQGAGCCVYSAAINRIRLTYAVAGLPIPRFTGKEAIAAYSEGTGYVIGDDSTDNGTDMRVMLNQWRTKGIADADGVRHKILAYAAININNLQAELEALYLFDAGSLIGIRFPSSAMTQFNQGRVWSNVRGAKDEGGHALDWDAHRNYEYVETWGRDQKATSAFIKKQIDEAWAVFMPEILTNGKSLEGFDMATLLADLKAITK